jgi:matrixin
MHLPQSFRIKLLCVLLCLVVQPAGAITIQMDYTYDTGNFFGSGNPSGATAGAQAKAALEAAASFYSTILTNSFSQIQTPAQFHSNTFDGQVTWQWTENFTNPTTNAATVVSNATIAANQYIVYAGARSLTGSTAGIGGPGGYGWSSNPTGGFTQSEIDQINTITNTFQNQVEKRGQASGFTKWGGAITFDNDGSTQWFYNHLGAPSASLTDFYSIALHELGHSLGLGGSTEWQAFVSGSNYLGPNAVALNGGNAVPLSADHAHWANGTQSVVYGGATAQEALMDPDLLNGTRKKLTELDAAGLKDIGWSLGPAPAGVNGDYNSNGVVDAGDYVLWRRYLGQSKALPNRTTTGVLTNTDYTVWRANFGKMSSGSGSGSSLAGGEIPEPASGALVLLLTFCVYFNRSTLRR